MKVKSLSCVRPLVTPWTAAHQAPPSPDSPSKNTGVGCHFLLQCMKVKSGSEVTQLCPTLSKPMDCSLPGSSTHLIFQARVLAWVAITFSSYLTNGFQMRKKKACPMSFSTSAPSVVWYHIVIHSSPRCSVSSR